MQTLLAVVFSAAQAATSQARGPQSVPVVTQAATTLALEPQPVIFAALAHTLLFRVPLYQEPVPLVQLVLTLQALAHPSASTVRLGRTPLAWGPPLLTHVPLVRLEASAQLWA